MEKTAKEMFEELGYECSINQVARTITYTNNEPTSINKRLTIKFRQHDYTLSHESFDGYPLTTYVDIGLHLAITQQMKELGWIE